MSGNGHRDAEAPIEYVFGITQTYSNTDVNDACQSKDSKYLDIEGYLITFENGKEAMIHGEESSWG